jgi:rare lipoprotein A
MPVCHILWLVVALLAAMFASSCGVQNVPDDGAATPSAASLAARPEQSPAPSCPPQVGTASYYGRWHHGRLTASGERFDLTGLTAAHRTLPFGTVARVTDVSSGRSVTVRITDRGPFLRGRVIDLSFAAAQQLGMVEAGLAKVRIEVLGEPPGTRRVAAG